MFTLAMAKLMAVGISVSWFGGCSWGDHFYAGF